MLRTIVVPLDGSELSESALPVAVTLAGAFDAGVVLLTSGWGSTVEQLDEYLQRTGQALGASRWSTAVVPDTFPATAISAAITDAGDSGLVLMATHGRSGIGKALLGSVAEDVLKATTRPVLLVGPSGHDTTPRPGSALIVSTDGSETSVSIVDDAIEWATALDLEVHVVGVTRADGSPTGRNDDGPLADRLDAVAERIRAAGPAARVERLTADDAAGALVDLAGALPAALVAMATHGRTGLARTALGSTAMKVVRNAPCPVLVRRPGVGA